MSTDTHELDKILHEFELDVLGNKSTNSSVVQAKSRSYTDKAKQSIKALIESAIQEARKETEKAYGGCQKCYGKGYATAIDYMSGHDTDQDIGSPGGKFRFQNKIMRYCDCDRGKQLVSLTNSEPTNKEGA